MCLIDFLDIHVFQSEQILGHKLKAKILFKLFNMSLQKNRNIFNWPVYAKFVSGFYYSFTMYLLHFDFPIKPWSVWISVYTAIKLTVLAY